MTRCLRIPLTAAALGVLLALAYTTVRYPAPTVQQVSVLEADTAAQDAAHAAALGRLLERHQQVAGALMPVRALTGPSL